MKNTLSKAILSYAIQYHGQWSAIGQAIKNNQPYQPVTCTTNYVTIMDDAYPICFRRLRYPPWILFYKGKLELLDQPTIGIVGARQCSKQALINTETVVKHLRNRYCIVSGLAKGIDGQAHRFAKHTIGFIGCGIDRIYPKENADLYASMSLHQLIMSEYPLDTPPYRSHFPWRNRLIAGRIDALIVIEATHKSGTMLTVNECNTLGVPVFCLPTAFENETYPGCNHLIEAGAMIIPDPSALDTIL